VVYFAGQVKFGSKSLSFRNNLVMFLAASANLDNVLRLAKNILSEEFSFTRHLR